MLRNRKNIFMIVFMAIFVIGYMFFFSSNLYMHDSTKYYSPMQTSSVLYGRTFTLLEWHYAAEQNQMEVLLSVQDMSYEGEKAYVVEAKDKNKGLLDAQIYLQDSDLIVVRINNIPHSFTDIYLQFMIDDSEKDSYIRFYTNAELVETVEKIEDKPLYQYEIEQILVNNQLYQDEIDAYEIQKNEMTEKIANANQIIEDLSQSVTYKTDEEITEIQNDISKVMSDISSMQTQLKSIEDSINEKNLQIQNGNYRIHEIEKNNGVMDVE